MSYCVSNIIGIRTGGVFSGDTDVDDVRRRIAALVAAMDAEAEASGEHIELPISRDAAKMPPLSPELHGNKGSYVVIAGVFNYWSFDHASKFSRRLSLEFGTEVMHMCWDEERDTVQCNVFLAGEPMVETAENPIGRILRRVG